MTTQLIQSGGIQQTFDYSALVSQIIYLDFDGELTTYHNSDLGINVDVAMEDSHLSQERIAQILAALNEQFSGQNVKFVSDNSGLSDYSTIYIGKTSSFEPYGSFAGLAETVDSGNKIKNDNAFVILDSASDNSQIINTIAHEAGHLLGTLEHEGDGLEKYAAYYKVASGVTSTGNSFNSDEQMDVIEGHFTIPKTFYGNVVIKATADGECNYPACVQLMSPNCTVTVEGGSLECDSIRNACILFGEDAYWVNYYGYGEHYDGTVTFTGATASFESRVSNCITAAGIIGKNLTVNFEGDADKSAGITFYIGQNYGPGDLGYAISADENLTINGTFGGTAVSLFDFSLFTDNERWAYAEGFDAGETLTVNGDISGTLLAFAYAPTETANGYGLKAGYNKALTVSGTISGTVAAFGEDAAYALYGGWINVTIDGTLIAGKAYAGKTEDELLSLIRDTKANETTLRELSAGYNAIYSLGYGTSQITLKSGARIFGGISVYGNLDVSSNAFISGEADTTALTVTLDDLSDSYVFQSGWSKYISTITINADNAQNGTYKISNAFSGTKNITVVCGGESKTMTLGSSSKISFNGGKSLAFDYSGGKLTLTASGFVSSKDTEAPDITNVSVKTEVNKKNVLISWTPAEDDTGVTQYMLRYASVNDPEHPVQITVVNEQEMLKNLKNGSYTVQIKAGDAAENWSNWTEAQTFTVNAESTDVTLPYELPQAEYMYGCVATSVAMILGYYDLYGYNGYDTSNIIPGTITVNSRGTDGDAYDMDAFDTVLGNFTASPEYVSRFYKQSKAAELLAYGDISEGVDLSCFNCLADWLGTGQYWRNNADLSTREYFMNLADVYDSTQIERIDNLTIPIQYIDYKYGLDQYLQTVGYKLDPEKTASEKVDLKGGSFTFEDYMAEIDAGRPVVISIESENGGGHSMVGYGYNAEFKEIIFDDTYEKNKKMAWDGTYSYADDTYHLKSVTTIVLDETALTPAVLPTDLQGNENHLSWKAADKTTDYVVEYSQDNFVNCIQLKVSATELDSFALPEGTWQWRVRSYDSTAWVDGNTFTAQKSAEAQKLVSDADGNGDIFFGNAVGVWEKKYAAQHVGVGTWNGTGEKVQLEGKNQITDIFIGSEDANLLVLTDNAHGDALFVDDIYSTFPSEIQQSRIAQIDEIRAGIGDDIVDMTSDKFFYEGDGLTIRGGSGNDIIWANHGDNKLFGDAGDDRIVGASGNDVIAGGSGDDSLHGGGGNDIFCFCEDWGHDTVEQLADGTVTLWFASNTGSWDESAMKYTDGANIVEVAGVSTVTIKYADDSAECKSLVTQGAFMQESSEKIFEEKQNGVLAVI